MALSKQRRQNIKRRAVVEARREFAGSSAGARAQIGQANRDYGREVADARGAHNVAQSQLTRMLRGVGQSGLRGPEARQLKAGLRSSIAQSAAGVPYGVAQAQQRRADAVSSARADLAASQADLRSAIGKRTNTLLADARKAKLDRAEDRVSAAEKAKKDMRGVKNAMVVARSAFMGAKREHQIMFLQNPDRFAAKVAENTKGADATDARKAVRRLFKQVARQGARSAFESIYGPGSSRPKTRRR